jgi:hypothetical protein
LAVAGVGQHNPENDEQGNHNERHRNLKVGCYLERIAIQSGQITGQPTTGLR